MRRHKKKKLVLVFGGLLVLYAAWLSWQVIRFSPAPPPPAAPLSAEGVYHVHTTHSDGKKTPAQTAAIASRLGLDFIILTDHGSPNLASLASKGYQHDVLLLAGAEFSVNRGHLAALDEDLAAQKYSRNAEEAAYQVQKSQGITIIAHPYSKVHWTWGEHTGYSGIEIISADAMLRKNFLSIIPYLPALLFRPKLALLKLLSAPEKNLHKWDELSHASKIYGYYSTDAHLLYKPLFELLRLHLELERPLASDFATAERQVYQALRQGRFYNAVDGAASARGFRFWGEHVSSIIPMGSSIAYDPMVNLFVQAPPGIASEIRLLSNGVLVRSSSAGRLEYNPSAPGVYRVEVYLRTRSPLSRKCPWILSNPIYLRKADHVTD